MISLVPYPGYGGLSGANLPNVIGSSISSGLWTAAGVTGGPSNPLGLGLTIAAGVTSLVTGLLGVFGVGVPDMTKIAASNDVNQLEPYLQQNLAWWQASSTPHTIANQQQGIAVFTAVWNKVLSECGDPSLGNAGKNCIGDRQRGGKWDWFRMYLDPIANSPTTDSGTIIGDASSLGSSLGLGSNGALWLGVGVVAFGILLVNE